MIESTHNENKGITWACIVGWVVHALSFAAILFYEPSPSWRADIEAYHGPYFMPFRLCLLVILSLALVGYWFRRKIGVYIYVGASLAYVLYPLFFPVMTQYFYYAGLLGIISLVGVKNLGDME